MDISRFVTGPLSVNTLLVPAGDQTALLVDPGGYPASIIAYLSQSHITVSAIVMTHGHFDHLLGLGYFAKAYPEAAILVHPDDSVFLGPGALERHYDFFGEIGAESVIRRYRDPVPQATGSLVEGMVLGPWHVLHTPGHSPGSICLYNEGNGTLVSGDTLFRSGWGRTDGPGGDEAALLESLKRLFTLPDETRVIPGHGGETTIGRERFAI